jgi:hypothetical protein
VESDFADASACLAGLTQLVRNAPADAARIVLPKFRRLNSKCSSFLGFEDPHVSQPLGAQVLHPFSGKISGSGKSFMI